MNGRCLMLSGCTSCFHHLCISLRACVRAFVCVCVFFPYLCKMLYCMSAANKDSDSDSLCEGGRGGVCVCVCGGGGGGGGVIEGPYDCKMFTDHS